MIAFLKGTLAQRDAKHALIDINGVGYKVEVPANTKDRLPDIGSEVTLHTHYYLRDNDLKLYGFISTDELKLFEISLTVKGIGPSLALNIVSKLSPAEFQRAVRDADHTTLMRVPRLNKEVAQLVIIKLKNTIRKIQFTEKLDERGVGGQMLESVSALMGLGVSEEAAEEALAEAEKILGPTAKREDLIRLALARLR